jgi:hypothetical protein
MPEHTSATEAYFVKQDGLVYARFSDDRNPARGVDFAGPASRPVNPATGEKGSWKASWSRVTVIACYDENDDLHAIEIIGVPSRRPTSKPEDWSEPH